MLPEKEKKSLLLTEEAKVTRRVIHHYQQRARTSVSPGAMQELQVRTGFRNTFYSAFASCNVWHSPVKTLTQSRAA